MPPKRMTANPVKAPRYRPGKPLAEDPSSESEEEESDEEEQQQQVKKPSTPAPKYASAGAITSNLSKVDLNERRRKAAAEEAVRIEREKALRAEEEEGFVTEEESEDEDEEESGEEDSEDEDEESSEEEAPRRVLMRPTFIKKDKRNANASGAKSTTALDSKAEEEKKAAEEEARRKAAADEIVEEQIRKDIAARAAGKKNWDDEDDEGDDVDDTDDIDPEAEHAAWKLRELKRIKRDREAIEAREKELEEIERRKNLTEEERKAEDDAYIANQKDEQAGKGKMSYMQKYYHSGAFFQDDAKEMGLDRRDIMGSRFADDVQNRDLLPQALQLRDQTKIGKRGATKYRDLKSEDTGRWGVFEEKKRDRGPGGFGGAAGIADERFLPDRERDRTGANNIPVGERKRERERVEVEGAPQGPKAMREGGDNNNNERRRDGRDSYRPGSDRGERSRDRHQDDDRHRRKRSSSRDRVGDRHESDKRRRVEA